MWAGPPRSTSQTAHGTAHGQISRKMLTERLVGSTEDSEGRVRHLRVSQTDIQNNF